MTIALMLTFLGKQNLLHQEIVDETRKYIEIDIIDTDMSWFDSFTSVLRYTLSYANGTIDAQSYEQLNFVIATLAQDTAMLRNRYTEHQATEESENLDFDPAAAEGTQAEIGRSPSIVECLSLKIDDTADSVGDSSLSQKQADQLLLLERYADAVLAIKEGQSHEPMRDYETQHTLLN